MKKKIILGSLVLLLVFLAVCYAADITINTTGSWPRGIYHSKKIIEPITAYRDQFVLVCLDPDNPVIKKALNYHILKNHSPQCDNGLAPFLKKLVGLPGDKVKITNQGVVINGRQLVNSQLKSEIFELIIHSGYNRTLQPKEYWVMATYSPNSLDSRYFGPVQRSAIIKASEPLFIIK